jgi:hypothetical protein
MYFKSKKLSLSILAITSILFTGVLLFLYNDPENKTLVVGIPLAILIYILSLAFYIFDPQTKPTDFGNQIDPIGVSVFQHLSLLHLMGFKRLVFAIVLQIIVATGFFLYWN